MADTSDDIYNLYKGCEECGDCCRLTVLAVTEDEISRIKVHMSENSIEAVDRGPGRCPFQQDDYRCSIYSVRPRTCRLHSCLAARSELKDMNPELDIPEDPVIIDMRMTFIHGQTVDPRTMPEDWIIAHYSE